MDLIFTIFAAILGAVVGSFLNVVILRLPEKKASIVFPGSHCPLCGHQLSWWENIPLLSYLLLRGKCRGCHAHISWQYPLVEALMALLSFLLWHQFGMQGDFAAFGIYFVFFAALLVIIFIDIHHQIIPDVISLPGIVLGFAVSFANSQVTWLESGLGILLGGGSLFVIAYGYALIAKRDGMGGGDIKLLGMIGAFLGWQSLLYVLFASSLLGSITGIATMLLFRQGMKSRLPFGPFLAFGAMSWVLLHDEILWLWHWYIMLMH